MFCCCVLYRRKPCAWVSAQPPQNDAHALPHGFECSLFRIQVSVAFAVPHQPVPQGPNSLFWLPGLRVKFTHRVSAQSRHNKIRKTFHHYGIIGQWLKHGNVDGTFDSHAIDNQGCSIDQKSRGR